MLLAAMIFSLLQAPVELGSVNLKREYSRGGFGRMAFANNGLASGYYVDFYGHHGEDDFSKPYVIDQHKLIWLPLGKSEYGKALATDGKQVVGHVLVDYRSQAAMWTPDPAEGWKKPKLQLLGVPGSVIAIGKDGGRYIEQESRGQKPESVWIYKSGKATKLFERMFRLVHVDASGRLLGNRFTAYAFGGGPHDPRGAIYTNGTWTNLADGFALNYANPHAIVGTVRDSALRASILDGGTAKLLPIPAGANHSNVTALGASGLIGGYVYIKDEYRPCVWRSGKYVDAGNLLPGVERGGIVGITNDDRLIVAVRQGKQAKLVMVPAP